MNHRFHSGESESDLRHGERTGSQRQRGQSPPAAGSLSLSPRFSDLPLCSDACRSDPADSATQTPYVRVNREVNQKPAEGEPEGERWIRSNWFTSLFTIQIKKEIDAAD